MYIEGVHYFYNMIFSIFYHACDQELFFYCLFNYDGLQLADFISSYTSFLVTILSIAAIKRTWKMFGYFVCLFTCISISLFNRFNFLPFVIVILCTVLVTLLSWIKERGLKLIYSPNWMLFILNFLPGISLISTGFLFFFLSQNKKSYWIYHSIWHICIASSVVFFIPKNVIEKFGNSD